MTVSNAVSNFIHFVRRQVRDGQTADEALASGEVFSVVGLSGRPRTETQALLFKGLTYVAMSIDYDWEEAGEMNERIDRDARFYGTSGSTNGSKSQTPSNTDLPDGLSLDMFS